MITPKYLLLSCKWHMQNLHWSRKLFSKAKETEKPIFFGLFTVREGLDSRRCMGRESSTFVSALKLWLDFWGAKVKLSENAKAAKAARAGRKREGRPVTFCCIAGLSFVVGISMASGEDPRAKRKVTDQERLCWVSKDVSRKEVSWGSRCPVWQCESVGS